MEIVQSLYLGGRSVRIEQTVNGLRANGNNVVVASLAEPDKKFDIESLVILPCDAKIPWRIIFKLVKLIKQHDIDVIHAHCEKTQLIAGVAGWLTKTPLVATVHRSDLKKYLPSRINSLVKCVATHFVAVSSERLMRLHKQLEIPLDCLTTIHGGVNPRTLPNESMVAELKQELNIVENKCILLSLGHMGEIKGHSDTLDALSTIDKSSYYLYIAGTGSAKEIGFIKDKINSLGLESNVELLGQLADVNPWLDCCDVFVQPSREEAFGLVFIESGLAGKPVIATKIGGIQDIVINQKTGILVDIRQPAQLAVAIETLINDQNKRKQMGLAGAHHINEHFLIDDMISDYENLFIQITKRKVSRWKQLLQ